jgi:hypothetical protein
MTAGLPAKTGAAVNSESQGSDKLRDILRRAKERSAATIALPAAQERAQSEAGIESLLDRSQPMPDPRALSRLYKEQALASRLPDSIDDEVSAATAAPPAPGVPVGEDAPPPPVWAEEPAAPAAQQPSMTAAEIREVMSTLQSEFGQGYTIFEPPRRTEEEDQYARGLQEQRDRELEELKRLAEESERSSWLYLLGGALVAVVVGVFIYLAASGPLHASPAPKVSPSASASAGR